MKHITPPAAPATPRPPTATPVGTTRNDIPGTWNEGLANAVRDPDTLIDLLGLPDDLRESARRAARLFPLVAPRELLARVRRGNPDDPLLRQILPLDVEADEVRGYTLDPLAEERAERAPGLLHKYRGRALLVAAGVCAINCRYCFRRHFPYDKTPHGIEAWKPALDELRADVSIHEIILSGGDPLVLTDVALARLVERLDTIAHLRRLRIHTRLPVVIPQRVDDALVGWLRRTRLTPVVVVHTNHPNEIDDACAAAFGRLIDAGIPVLNQTVLLRGVNDDADVLTTLCERLADLRVMPYYLHQLDAVTGTAHFHVDENRGLEIVAALRMRLPGYAVPRYVREAPGIGHKVEIRHGLRDQDSAPSRQPNESSSVGS